MHFRIDCKLLYKLEEQNTFIFNIAPLSSDSQKIIEESFETEPTVNLKEFNINNEKRLHRAIVNSSYFEIKYSGTVETKLTIESDKNPDQIEPLKLPLETLEFLNPSRYCESDKLERMASKEFFGKAAGFKLVTYICNWINDNVEYLKGTTDTATSAFDTATEREGVCRDFAHLGIAFCRALGIPARFCSAYSYNLKPQDFHAYFEAFLGDKWYIFDATRMSPQTGFIKIGNGRDAADTSFATIFGNAVMNEMEIDVQLIKSEDKVAPDFTTEPLSFN